MKSEIKSDNNVLIFPKKKCPNKFTLVSFLFKVVIRIVKELVRVEKIKFLHLKYT